MNETGTLRVGIDLVLVSRIAESIERFGDRFLRRIFTAREIAYATAAPAQTAERLAARFAAKEATIKALRLRGRAIDWRDIEVCRTATGFVELALRGAAAEAAARCGASDLAVSLSHEGDLATAVVVTRVRENSAA
ncbi:MAG TPA: holo-ACP synthase [Gemmatimonadaceae bacterium]|nr:holo-ACP synthase [Gemmatimonadaceae bacterium]